MRIKTIALLIVGVLLFAGGFLGHDALQDRAAAKGPWTVAYVRTSCDVVGVGFCDSQDEIKPAQGDPAGDQGVYENLIARLDRDSCEWRDPIPDEKYLVVTFRC